jgi:hypothetical protein
MRAKPHEPFDSDLEAIDGGGLVEGGADLRQ